MEVASLRWVADTFPSMDLLPLRQGTPRLQPVPSAFMVASLAAKRAA